MRGVWDDSVKPAMERLRKLGPAAAPFELSPGSMVVDPVKFHEAFLAEVPGGARSVTGAFQTDLKAYLAVRERKESGAS